MHFSLPANLAAQVSTLESNLGAVGAVRKAVADFNILAEDDDNKVP